MTLRTNIALPLLALAFAFALAVWLAGGGAAQAELTRFEVQSSAYLDGREFGAAGRYQMIVGAAHFALDPELRQNREIVDLGLAPRGGDGRVEFDCDLFLLTPADPGRSNGCLLYDVNNRGNKLALRFFNDAPSGNEAADPGNGFLLESGYTIVWSGWNGELLPGGRRLQLRPPTASGGGRPLTGRVRYELATDDSNVTLLPVSRDSHGAFRPADDAAAELTWRVAPEDPRVPIPRTQFALRDAAGDDPPGQLPLVQLELPAGFHPGYLYELVYTARDPQVHGVCFASVRDLIAALKSGGGAGNPLAPAAAQRAVGFGVSQSGRFLRELLYSGFNEDEAGRRVFDGLIPHVAGAGLGSFNHRFAQPTAFATQRQLHDWPTDRFPFSYATLEDPLSGRRDGLLQRARAAKVEPLVMHTQTSTEYWSRGGSLVHTDPLGRRDAAQPENVRIYAFGGCQHGHGAWPPQRGAGQTFANPADYRPQLRALLTAMEAWIREGKAPPASQHPRLDDGTLVDWRAESTRFPAIPGIRYPERIHIPQRLDWGPRWDGERIADRQPPRPAGAYRVLVPRSGADGNEQACALPAEVAAPRGTYTGWSLRAHRAAGGDQLVGLNGSYIPFPASRQEREKLGDPRLSFEERYGDSQGYAEHVRQACQRLVEAGLLLPRETPTIVARLTAQLQQPLE